MSHTSIINEDTNSRCSCPPQHSILFLDISLSIENGRISTDLYKKPTDQNQYLLTSSCHPNQTTLNIPFSLGLCIVRICSVEEQREQRFLELKCFLLDREYKPGLVDSAINRARAIPRKEALKESVTDPSTTLRRPIFAVTWDPRLPSIPSIQNKHWRSMVSQNPYLAEVFAEPPLTAYKRQRNIRDNIVRAKVPPPQGQYPKRHINGMKKCERGCIICPFVKEAKHVKANTFTWSINSKVNCHTKNIVYLLQCTKENCNLKYIGESEKAVKRQNIRTCWLHQN